MNRSSFDDIILDATAADEALEAPEEEKVEDEEDAFIYDRALYDADDLDEDEDIEFDDWSFTLANCLV